MVQNHHDGGLVGAGVNFQIPADADEAGAVVALVLHGGAQTIQPVQLGAGAAGQGGNVLSAGLGDHLGGEGSVAVHIRHLREKIEINPSEPRYLKVMWGQGYKLEGESK